MISFSGLIWFVLLMLAGYGFGTLAEKRHYKSIKEREERYRHVVLLAQRFPRVPNVRETALVTGSVVVSVDYFKRFLAGLRMLFGGSLGSYETLLDRSRREAILRMQQQAHELNASYVYNVRFETSSISKGQNDRIGSIELLAYGTAIICD